jgi:hypothetical protein
MDPVTLAYYAVICGLLSLAAPRLATPMQRFVAGVLVGLVAAGGLPFLRALGG